MPDLKLGRDYRLQFEEPYASEEKQQELTAFIEEMFEKIPLLADRVLKANALHTDPVTILFTKTSYGVDSLGSIDNERNAIYLHPDEVKNHGYYDPDKGCVVNGNVAVIIGHELFHLGDQTLHSLHTDQFLNEDESATFKALSEYFEHEAYQRQSPEDQANMRKANPDIANLTKETVDLMQNKCMFSMPNAELEGMLNDLENTLSKRIMELHFAAEQSAVHSEQEISGLFSEGTYPERNDYVNMYRKVDGVWFWESDKATQQATEGFLEQSTTDYPTSVDWCGDAKQPDIYSLPSAINKP